MKINECEKETQIDNLIVEVEHVGNIREGEKNGNKFQVITIGIRDLTGRANLDCFRENFLIAKGLKIGQHIKLINCYCKKWCDIEKFKGWDISTGKEGKIEVL